MSFNSDVKEELTRVPAVCSHCERALLAALIRIEGTLFISGQGRYRLEVVTDAPSVARLAWRLLHETYGLRTELTTRRSVLHKTPNYLIDVPAQSGLVEALRDMGVLGDAGLELGVAPSLVAKQCCAAAYLRGAFLGSGFTLIIYLYSLGLSFYQLLPSAYTAIEVISGISSSIGMILAIPLTACISAVLLEKGTK